jgi:hypothetical protein
VFTRICLKIISNTPLVMIDEPVQPQQFNWIGLGFKLIVLVKHNIRVPLVLYVLKQSDMSLFIFILFCSFLFRKYVFFQTTKHRAFSKKQIFTKLMHF